MGTSRIPGILDHRSAGENLDDGTLVRQCSPRPGHVGAHAGLRHDALANRQPVTPRRQPRQFPALRMGSQGESVRKLQQLLNDRLDPGPQLQVDGVFGARTNAAVVQFQQGTRISTDGVAGNETWFHLLKGDRIEVPATTPGAAAAAAPPAGSKPAMPSARRAASPGPAAGKPVNQWPLPDRFAEVMRRTAPKLPGGMRHEFEALLSPGSLAMIGATLVLWAGGHVFGVSEAVDIVLLLAGGVFLGMAVFTVAHELHDFLELTCQAEDETDLDVAASHLAKAVAIIGVTAFVALLAKVARGKGGGAEEAGEAEAGAGTGGARAGRARGKSPATSEPASEAGTRELPAKPAPILKSVSQSEMDLAASEGSSPAQIGARKNIARAFYEEQAKGSNSEFWNDDRISDHLKGIDYSKPVKVRTSPPPTEVVQWQTPGGSQGTYYAEPGTEPNELGIGNYGAENGRVVEKVPKDYTLAQNTPILESTAAPMNDTWSVAPGKVGKPGQLGQVGIIQETGGGGTQYFAPNRSAASGE